MLKHAFGENFSNPLTTFFKGIIPVVIILSPTLFSGLVILGFNERKKLTLRASDGPA